MSAEPDDAAPDLDQSSQIDGYFPGLFWTPEIERQVQRVGDWVSCDLCGAHLWGAQRVGKSTFAVYLQRVSAQVFGCTTVVIRWSFQGVRPTKVLSFLKHCLVKTGVRAIGGRDEEVLRLRLHDAVLRACSPSTKRVIIIVDEMQNVALDLYGEIMMVTEIIEDEGYTPFVLSIGQPEMQQTIKLFHEQVALQYIGRFFEDADEYKGLTLGDIALFLANLDGCDREFSRRHFPRRFDHGWTISELLQPISESIGEMANWMSMQREPCIPAGTLRQSLMGMFRFLNDPDNAAKTVDKSVATAAFKPTGLSKLIVHYSVKKVAP